MADWENNSGGGGWDSQNTGADQWNGPGNAGANNQWNDDGNAGGAAGNDQWNDGGDAGGADGFGAAGDADNGGGNGNDGKCFNCGETGYACNTIVIH